MKPPKEEQATNLLKKVLALHGWAGHGANGLTERGIVINNVHSNACNAEMMGKLDEEIKSFLE